MATTTDEAALDLAKLGQNLREIGATGLKKDLVAAIKDAADTIPPTVRRGLIPRLPDRYAAILDEDLDMGNYVHTSTADPGVWEYARPRVKQRRLPRLDSGILWHPVFADRTAPRRTWTWRIQELPSVQPGFFSDPVEDAAPRVREDIIAAIDRINDEVWAGV